MLLHNRSKTDNEWLQNISEKLDIPLLEQTYHGFITTREITEEHIRILKDYVDWAWISEQDHLSVDFLREWRNKIDWIIYFNTQNHLIPVIKNEFKKEYEESLK